MRIELLDIGDFRNYRQVRVGFAAGVTIVSGRNGQGKTNLLEAVYFVTNLSSWRSRDERHLIREGAESARIGCEVVAGGGRKTRVDVEIGGRARAFRNGKPLARRREILGDVRATIFSPEDLALVKGAPSVRRDWIDRLLVGLHPGAAGVKSDYERVLKQRNTLLRTATGRPLEERVLATWDAQLVRLGAELARRRREVLDHASPLATRAYADATSGEARRHLAISYVCSFDPAGEGGENALARALEGARDEELRRGVSLVGPHRDDILISIDGRDARIKASQGEQRTAALALRLAEHDAAAALTGEPGVLLLDDVFSELDACRSSLLATRLTRAQAIITAAGRLPDDVWGVADLRIEVSEGELRDISPLEMRAGRRDR